MSLHAAILQQLTQQCQNKSGQACHDLGYLYDQKGKVDKASKLYRRACDLRHAMGCYRLAELYLIGSGVKQSDRHFATYAKKACDLGYKKSCSFGKQLQPAITLIQQTTNRTKTISKNIVIKEKSLGNIAFKARLIDKEKRLVQIDASMTNHLGKASGWLSFSFPNVTQDILLKSQTTGFDRIRSYHEGKSIFSIANKKPMRSKYLLIEGEAMHWEKGQAKKPPLLSRCLHNSTNSPFMCVVASSTKTRLNLSQKKAL